MKAVVEKILNLYFGKFISGVDRENLHFNLLSGNFKVNDISFNQTYFDGLDLPLRIAYSHIGELNISAPISKFGTVTCILEDIFIIFQFKDESSQKNINDVKLKQKIIQKYAQSSLDYFLKKVNQQKDGVMKTLVKKVINNLILKIKNIHVRFQQKTEKASYSFGLTLKSVTFLPTDEQWNTNKVVNEQQQDVSSTLYKKMKIEELNVYWNQIPTFWIQRKQEQVLSLMRQFISNSSDTLFHISTDTRVKIQNGEDQSKPLYQLHVLLSDFEVEVSRVQVHQIILFFERLTLQSELKLIIKNKESNAYDNYKQPFQKYIKQYVLGQDHYNPEIQTIYSEVAASKLYEWIIEKIKVVVKQEKIQQEKKKKQGWFGWLKSSVSLQELEDDIEQMLQQDQQREGSSPFCSISLQAPNGKLRVSNIKNALKNQIQLTYNRIELTFNISTDSKSVSLRLALSSMQLDLIEEHNQVKQVQNILSTTTQNTKQELFQITYSKLISSSINVNTTVEVSQVLLNLKALSFKKIRQILNFGDFKQGFRNTVYQKISQLKQALVEETKLQTKAHFVVNIVSPLIKLYCVNHGYYLFNFGVFNLDSENDKYKLAINQTSIAYFQDQSDEVGQYLIGNMNIQTLVEIQPTYKNIKVTVPKISVNISSEDILRLMEIYQLFCNSKAIQTKSLKDRRNFIQKSKQFQSKVSLKSSSGGWKDDHLIISGYFIYIYEHQLSLQEYLIIPIKNLAIYKQEDTLIMETKEGLKFVFKYNEELQPLVALVNSKKIDLASQQELIQIFGHIAIEGDAVKKSSTFLLDVRNTQIRYHTSKPVLSIYIDDYSLRMKNEGETHKQIQMSIKQIQVQDLMHKYNELSHQHFILIKGQEQLSIVFRSEVQKQCTKENILIKIPEMDLNWKPQLFLQLHSLYKAYKKYEGQEESKDRNWKYALKRVNQNTKFVQINDQYQRSQNSVKQNKQRFVTAKEYQKHHQLLIFREAQFQVSIRIHLFHRQTNIIISKIQCNRLHFELVQSFSAIFVKGSIADFKIYQVGNYSNSLQTQKYQNKPSHLVLSKNKESQQQIMQFQFSTFGVDQFSNKQRIVSFLNITLSEFDFHYYHQYSMRLFDYFMIQVLCVVFDPELVIANKNLLQQLSEQQIKEEISVIQNYDNALKKFISPFFMDININLHKIQIYLKPSLDQETFFIGNVQNIHIYNNIKKQSKRFSKSNLHTILFKYVWEEDFIIQISKFSLFMINHKTKQSEELIVPINLTLNYNKHINDNLIRYLFKDIGEYDETSYLNGHIEEISVNFTRWNYLNFLKFINFNILYEDLRNHLYDHNYKITQYYKPRPMKVNINISHVHFTANHQEKVIFTTKSKNLQLVYYRTNNLSKIISLSTKDMEVLTHDHLMFRYFSPDSMLLQYKINNRNKRNLNIQMGTTKILISYPDLMVILEWINTEPWVDTVTSSYTPEMNVDIAIKDLYFALKTQSSNTIFVKGQIIFNQLKEENLTDFNELQQKVKNKKFKIDQLNHPISNSKCQLSIQVFRCQSKDFITQNISAIKKRNLVNKTSILITSRQLYKVEKINRVIESTRDTVIFIPTLSFDFSITDIMIFQRMAAQQQIPPETKLLIQKIKQSGHQIQVQKQIFSTLVLTINQSTVHFINSIGDCFVPLLMAKVSQFHSKINYNKYLLEATISLSPLLKFYNGNLITWQPFLQNCQLSLEASIHLFNNKKIMKFYCKNQPIFTISRSLLSQTQSVFRVVSAVLKYNEQDRQQFQTIQYFNSVTVVNYTGYSILLNQQNLNNGQMVRLKIPFSKQNQKDSLVFNEEGVESIVENILHCHSTKKVFVKIGTQRYPLIIKPVIKDLKKYVKLQGIYQIKKKDGEIIHLPFNQDPQGIQYNGKKLKLSQIGKLEAGQSIFSVDKKKNKITLIEQYREMIWNCLPISVKINGQQVHPQKSVGSNDSKLQIELNKSSYKLLSNSKNRYITCQSFIKIYDGELEVLQNGETVKKHTISNQKGEFIYNIFIVNNKSSKLQLRKKSHKLSFSTEIGKSCLQIKQKQTSFQYARVTQAKSSLSGQVQKVTTVSPKYILINSTNHVLSIEQNQKVITLSPQQRKIINFKTDNKDRDIIIKIYQTSYQSNILSLKNQNTQSFVLRSKEQEQFKIFCCDFILSENLYLIRISEQVNYKIWNQTQDFTMMVYQQRSNKKHAKQHQFRGTQTNSPFAFDYPKQGTVMSVVISSLKSQFKKQFLVDVDNTLFEQQIQVGSNEIYLRLEYKNGLRTLILSDNKQDSIKSAPSIQVEVDISSISISLVGSEKVRKQLLFAFISQISMKYQCSKNQLLLFGIVQNLHILNTRDPLKQNQDLVQSKKGPFLQVRLEYDMDSQKVIDYFGLSINQFAVNISSVDIDVLKKNFEEITKSWMLINDNKQNQNILMKKIDSSNRFYFDKMQIHPIKGIVTYRALGTENTLMKTFGNIDQAPIKVTGVCLTNLTVRNLGELVNKIIKAYTDNIYSIILPLIGNIAILGNPVSLLNKIGTGFKQFIQLPVQGFTISPLQGGKGLTKGTKSLLKNTLQGTMNSVSGISSSLGSGLATLTLDEQYEKQRQHILNRRSNGFIQSFLAGSQSLYRGIQSGVKGVISQPIKGGQQNGVGGFLIGGIKGLTGLALKPLSGILDMTTKTFEGIKNLSSPNADELKYRRHPARVFYNNHREYRIYNIYHSKLNQKLVISDQQLFQNLSWVDSYQINLSQTLVITIQFIIIFDKQKSNSHKYVRSQNVKKINKVSTGLDLIGQNDVRVLHIIVQQPALLAKIVSDVEEVIGHHY